MREISEPFPPSVIAGFVLMARELCPSLKGWPPSVTEILRLTEAGRSQAYEVLGRLRELAPTLLGKPGRPPSQPSAPTPGRDAVLVSVRDYLTVNPGAYLFRSERHTYHDEFRRFIIGLKAPGQPGDEMSLAAFASATGVPEGTIKDWLHLPQAEPQEQTIEAQEQAAEAEEQTIEAQEQPTEAQEQAAEAEEQASEPQEQPTEAEEQAAEVQEQVAEVEEQTIEPQEQAAEAEEQAAEVQEQVAEAEEQAAEVQEQVAEAEEQAAEVQEQAAEVQEQVAEADEPVAEADNALTLRNIHLRLIVTLWQSWKGPLCAFCDMLKTQHRIPYSPSFIATFLVAVGMLRRRRSRPVEAPWSSEAFRRLFPGAQWLGDGTTIAIRLNGQIFVFNIQAAIDAASNALTGLHVSDSEDEAAVRLSFEAGVETAGKPPLAFTLDNKPCNGTTGLKEALGETILLHATPGRGQAKAPIEGAFGLFQQALPNLEVTGDTLREMARSILTLILIAWSRGRNGRPRTRLNGRSPAKAYASAAPTPEEIQEALAWFRELLQRQERARLTREARLDPVRKELLRQGLEDLAIPDPEGRLAKALAYYSRDAIVRGLATFSSKRDNGTLPTDVSAHGPYLGGIIRNLHDRIELEAMARYLLRQRIRAHDLTLEPLQHTADSLRANLPPSELPQAFAGLALKATWQVDFTFWGHTAAKALGKLPQEKRHALYPTLSRQIAGSFKTDRERREDLIDLLAEATASTL